MTVNFMARLDQIDPAISGSACRKNAGALYTKTTQRALTTLGNLTLMIRATVDRGDITSGGGSAICVYNRCSSAEVSALL